MNAHFLRPTQATAGLPHPYLLFLGDVTEPGYAKTAFGLRDWAAEKCIGEYACAGATVSTGLTRLTPAEARARGAKALLIGVANPGGVIPETWISSLVEALEAGLDIVSGMHIRLEDIPALAAAATHHGRALVDVRRPPHGIPVATGCRRSGKRLLTVGTDCAVGKKYTALALTHAFQHRGVDAEFRATGQTGIMIAGSGMPMDAVVSDFEAGAAELLSPAAAADHWDVIEGQGSLFHPAYAAVSVGLLHGSQPDILVLCHEYERSEVLGAPGFTAGDIVETIDLNLRLGRLTNPSVRCGGIALNTSGLDAERADRLLASESARLGLPVADPVRGGSAFEALVDSCLA